MTSLWIKGMKKAAYATIQGAEVMPLFNRGPCDFLLKEKRGAGVVMFMNRLFDISSPT
jgi:hypothetical protein